ncbi:hypothetical protein QWY84_05540 [Aquisalimonas lutea]|uniref:hypothetical protein n=1 Tax=Aquisalimonas lutea TaxID=1327750 RepID=UPI0025B3B7D6|nr:hypothetical protein [Aquisalimonas lutea]MDN3517067.1 hypothetical protein [Aquisalimonas lutea]
MNNAEAKRHFLEEIHETIMDISRADEDGGGVDPQRDDQSLGSLGRLYARVAAMPEGHIVFSAWAKAWDLVGFEILVPSFNTDNPASFSGVREDLVNYDFDEYGGSATYQDVFLRTLVYQMIWFATGKPLQGAAYCDAYDRNPLQVPHGQVK